MLSRVLNRNILHNVKRNFHSSSIISNTSKELNEFLDVHNKDSRKTLKNLFKDEKLIPKYNQSLDQERQTAYDRLKAVCDTKCVSVKDFW